MQANVGNEPNPLTVWFALSVADQFIGIWAKPYTIIEHSMMIQDLWFLIVTVSNAHDAETQSNDTFIIQHYHTLFFCL